MGAPEEMVMSKAREMIERYQRGDVRGAIVVGGEALADGRALWGDHDLRVAELSHNLAELLRQDGRFGDALAAARRAVAIREELLAADDPLVANSVEVIAKIEDETEDLDGASATYDRVLAMRRARPGADERRLAETLGNIGVLRHRRGKDDEAIALYREARAILTTCGATDDEAYGAALINEAMAHKALGQWAESEALLADVLARRPDMPYALANLAEVYRQQGKLDLADATYARLFQQDQIQGRGLVEGNRGLLYADRGDYERALEYLQRSAAFDDARLADVFAIASEDQKLAQANAIQGHIYAALTLIAEHAPGSADLAATLMIRRKGLVLDAMARGRASLFRRATTGGGDALDAAQVRAALPEGAVLVDFVKYAPYRFGAIGGERFADPRYLAIVVTREGAELHPIGEAAPIDKHVHAHQVALANSRDFGPSVVESDPKAAAEELRARVFEPIAARVRGATKLYLVPDGELSLIPFAALPSGTGYLLDDHVITYLTSARELVADEVAADSRPPMIIADPAYGPEHERLRGTAREARAIATLLDVKPIVEDKATVAALAGAHSPRILHVACHGQFEPAADPMRGSGLVLADGVFDARAVSALDLAGTELVVLSACNTARGSVRSGEGVFGLRRAFAIAGARALVMSLWKIGDNETVDLMIELYRQLMAHPPAEALCLAQRAVRKAHGPAVWGAFVCQDRR